MTRVLLVAALLLVPLMAGCLGGQGDQASEPTSEPTDDRQGADDQRSGAEVDGEAGNRSNEPVQGPPPPFLLQGEGCRDARLRVPVDAEDARPLIPEGFTLERYGSHEGGSLPASQAALQVLTIRCDAGGLASGDRGWSLHLLALEVQPPEALRASQALQELFLLEAVSDEQPVAQAFGARGWNVSQGSVNLSLTSAPAGGAVFESQATGGNLSTGLQGSTTDQKETLPGGFVRYWHAPVDRLEYLHLALTSSHDRTNATGGATSQDPMSLTGHLVGPGSAGEGALLGPYSLLATPTIIRSAN